MVLISVSVLSQSTGPNGVSHPPSVNRFYLIREHRLHGIVTGIEGVRIITSIEDSLDRLLVSFKDAKVRLVCQKSYYCFSSFFHQIALLEWSDAIHDLITVSIHTYERAPQLVCEMFIAMNLTLTYDS